MTVLSSPSSAAEMSSHATANMVADYLDSDVGKNDAVAIASVARGNVNKVTDSGSLLFSLVSRYVEAAAALCTSGAVWRDAEVSALLKKALDTDSPAIIEALAKSGVDLSSFKNNIGDTYLHLAAWQGKVAIVKAMLDGGVDIDITGWKSGTALHRASLNGQLSTVQLLLLRRAAVNVCNDYQQTPLHLATLYGHKEMVATLCAKGAVWRDGEVNTLLQKSLDTDRPVMIKALAMSGVNLSSFKDSDGETYLHLAAVEGKVAIVKAMLDVGMDLNIKGCLGRTALHLSSCNGHLSTVQLLLGKGAVVNVRDVNHRTPLHLAARYGHGEVVAMLCAAGAVWRYGVVSTLLKKALDTDSTAIIKALAKSGVDLTSFKDRIGGDTFLHRAADEGKVAIVKAMLDGVVDINIKGRKGETALHRATLNGDLSTMQLLLLRRAAVNVRNVYEETPLFLAALNGHIEMVLTLCAAGAAWREEDVIILLKKAIVTNSQAITEALVKSGVDLISFKDCNGDTYLHLAARQGKWAIVKAMLDGGMDLNIKGWFGRTTLHWSSYNGDLSAVHLLLERGAAVDVGDYGRQTPLHLAIQKGCKEVVIALCEAGAVWRDNEINALLKNLLDTDSTAMIEALSKSGVDQLSFDKNFGKDYLCTAAWKGKVAIVEAMLDLGVDIDKKGCLGQTALHMASLEGHLSTVQLLLSRGAAVNVLDDDHQTPLHWAARYGHKEVEEVLCAAGAVRRDAEVIKLLNEALNSNDPAIIEALAKSSVNLSSFKDFERETYLHLAAREGKVPIVKAMLDGGMDINTKGGWQDRTALHFATLYGHLSLVLLLLRRGAAVDAEDRYRRTALHYAVRHHNIYQTEMVTVLLAAGEYIFCKDGREETPLDLAYKHDHTKVIQIMNNHGFCL